MKDSTLPAVPLEQVQARAHISNGNIIFVMNLEPDHPWVQEAGLTTLRKLGTALDPLYPRPQAYVQIVDEFGNHKKSAGVPPKSKEELV